MSGQQIEAVAVIDTMLDFGPGGKIVDREGRVICTMNVINLTVAEAMIYAKAFMWGAANFDKPAPMPPAPEGGE